jgi:hypothetical protein
MEARMSRSAAKPSRVERAPPGILVLVVLSAVIAAPLVAQPGQDGDLSVRGAAPPLEKSSRVQDRLTLQAPVWALGPIGETPSQFAGLRSVRAALRPRPFAPPSGSAQGEAEGRGWMSSLLVPLGALGGAVLGKLIYDQGCEGSRCTIDRGAVVVTFAVMGGLAGALVTRPDRHAGPDTSHVLDRAWERMRAVPVPAEPPDSLPLWIYAPENVAPPTQFILQPFVPRVVIVAFHPWAPVERRQRLIDLVGGAVIGGEPVLDGEGLYWVLIRDDWSGRGIREAVTRLKGQSGVAVVAPRYIDG